MPFDLAGQPIAITGASAGIGRATAIACARAGMPVAVGARRLDRLSELVREIESFGGRAVAVEMNVDAPADHERLVTTTIDRFGSLYAVFANAGYGEAVPVHEMTLARARAMFETNFWGSLATAHAALPHLLRAGRGHILLCSSCLARFSMPFSGIYCATKAAQLHAARAMHYELSPRGIHVSSVHPIGTRTEFFDEAKHRSVREYRPLIDPPGKSFFMQPAETVANAVVKCLRRPKPEVWTSALTRWAMAAAAAFPTVSSAVTRRMMISRLGRTMNAGTHPTN